MADEERLEILRSGVGEWNRWKDENFLTDVDLSGAALSEAALHNVNFEYANLSGADLRDADLRQADLCNANLSGADLRGADLTNAALRSADFREVDLPGASLSKADLSYAIFRRAYLRFASLRGSRLIGADFRDAYLRGADFCDAILRHANFRGARLGGAKLIRFDLFGADLSGADLSEAQLGWGNIDAKLDGVSGLQRIDFLGPSAIGADGLESAQGKLPDAFLKGIGFKDWEILSAKLHDPNLRADEVIDLTYQIADLRTNSPIQTNSIFFSYSSLDQDFVESIEKRFDDEGIRSWRDVHDLSSGPIEPQLDRAINLSGTVFLVLSEHSVNSDWVEWEVKRARRRQKDRQTESGKRSDVLFPVALDDSWKTCHWPGWLKEQILEYKVVDCSDWKGKGFQEKYETKIRKPLGIYYRDEDKGE